MLAERMQVHETHEVVLQRAACLLIGEPTNQRTNEPTTQRLNEQISDPSLSQSAAAHCDRR